MIAVLCVVAGLLLLLLLLVDVFRTVVAPSLRGPVAHRVPGLLLALATRAPRRARGRLVRYVGPLAVVGTIATWLVLLWWGFALFYVALLDGVVPPEGQDRARVLDAFYLSGESLTTVGFGDVVGSTDTVRALTVLESASGLALFTAALGYLPAIYAVISQVRAACRDASDLGAQDAAGAARLALLHPPGVERLRRDLIEVRQHLLRFPVLHYFRPPDAESPWQLLRSGGAVCAVLAAGAREGAVPGGAVLAPALLRALDALLDDVHSHVPVTPADVDAQRAEARELVLDARREVAAIDPAAACEDEDVDEAVVELLARTAAHVIAYGEWLDLQDA